MSEYEKDTTIVGFVFGVMLSVAFCLFVIFANRYSVTPSANDLADGKAWAEYTSDGQRHWVWRKQ